MNWLFYMGCRLGGSGLIPCATTGAPGFAILNCENFTCGSKFGLNVNYCGIICIRYFFTKLLPDIISIK